VISKDIHKVVQTEDDETLIRKSQLDPEAFRSLYEKYFAKIFLFVHHRIGEKTITADITSQVFLKALLNLRKFQFRGLPFSSWLYRIAVNECHDFFRRHKRYRMVALNDDTVEKLHEELTADTGVEDLHQKLPQIMEHLEEDELLIIELRFFEQRPFKEVADILGISEVYAKVKVYRTLDKMKKLFLKV
jgi:RNA polymerase sigma-70 factor, ECF subfamily